MGLLSGYATRSLTKLAGVDASNNVGLSTGIVTDTSGRVLIGSTTPVSGIGNLQITGTTAEGSLSTNSFFGNNAGGPSLAFAKSRGTTVGSYTIVASGDTLGTLAWYGSNGTALTNAASIFATVDTTPGASDMPGALNFATVPDGSTTLATNLKISNAGKVLAVNPTGGLGYGTGAGGTVTQITSKSTAVTLNKVCGRVITHTELTTAASGFFTFVVNNSAVETTDTVVVSVDSGGTLGGYIAYVAAVGAGNFTITVLSFPAESQAITINFSVIKAVIA